MGYLSRERLEAMGFASLGQDVLISEKASIYGAERIALGSRVRIDDFCLLSAGKGGITIGSNVHIAAFCSLLGQGEIVMEDFSGLACRVSIYSSSDDYSGDALTNPTVPARFTKVTAAPVRIARHVIIGSSAVVLPGSVLLEGCSVGALSLVKGSFGPWEIVAGQPARVIRQRRRGLLEREHAYLSFLAGESVDGRPAP